VEKNRQEKQAAAKTLKAQDPSWAAGLGLERSGKAARKMVHRFMGVSGPLRGRKIMNWLFALIFYGISFEIQNHYSIP
jgi:hypothetical protein